MKEIIFKILRSESRTKKKKLVAYSVPYKRGMRILDGLRHIQENIDPTLSFRWNCRAGTCGSCTMRVNGTPKLTCKTVIDGETKELLIEPLKTLYVVKDLLTDPEDVEKKLNRLEPWFSSRKTTSEFFELHEEEVIDVQEMKKCIHCYACFDVCPVVRSGRYYIGPKSIVNIDSFEMHPKDIGKRMKALKKKGLWNCVMSGCCSDVCPQDINISQNAIPYAKEKSLSARK